MVSEDDESMINQLIYEGKIGVGAHSPDEIRGMAPGYFNAVDDETLYRACIRAACAKKAMERKVYATKANVEEGKRSWSSCFIY